MATSARSQAVSGRALLFFSAGDLARQLEENRKAVAINRALVAAEPANTLFQRELAAITGNIGSNLMSLKDKAGAVPHFREALGIYEGLVAADAKDVSIRRAWAVAYRNVAVATGASDPQEALRLFQKATDILSEIVAKDPRNSDFRRQWAFTHLARCRFQVEIDDLEQAVASAREGIRIEEALVADVPGDATAQTTLALLYHWLGTTWAKWAAKSDLPKAGSNERWTKAKEAYAKSLAVYQKLKDNGKLSAADAAKPDEIAREIGKCDAALQAAQG